MNPDTFSRLRAAHSIGRAQSVPPIGMASMRLMTSASLMRGERFTPAMHAAVTTAGRSGEPNDLVFRLRCRRDERHGRTGFTRADAGTRNRRTGHRTAHVEREQ